MVSRVTDDKSAVRANVRARARSCARDVTKSAFPPEKKHQSTPDEWYHNQDVVHVDGRRRREVRGHSMFWCRPFYSPKDKIGFVRE